VCVDDVFYVATSTFEWFPGIRLHRSRDLVNWELAGHALDTADMLQLRGVADSAGVWAPSLSHHDGLFWLAYTVVHTTGHPYKDISNYVTTAPSVEGPWSTPVFLNASGFDPSLFHDDDGRSWLLNIQWDHREANDSFGGILLQEFDRSSRRLIGRPRRILRHDTLIEGPNLYRREGWYYLMLAEGGTGWQHGVLMSRSRSLTGPYELDPRGSLMTTRHTWDAPLLKAGHGSLVETPRGDWYVAFLASRPVTTAQGPMSILGRETCLEEISWTEDGWARLGHGSQVPRLDIPSRLPQHPVVRGSERDDFDAPALGPMWSTLRIPADPSWADLTSRPGWLRLTGRHSTKSHFEQSLVAQRLTAPHSRITTELDYTPDHFTQMAGLICWYDTTTYYYLRVTHLEGEGRRLGIVLNDADASAELPQYDISLDAWPRVFLRAEIDEAELQFLASPDGEGWQRVGPVLDAGRLSDDYGSRLRFTGAFVGLCAQDLNGTGKTADFAHFELRDTTPSGSEADR
jgi:xylan 1,4-beta-xylosidase